MTLQGIFVVESNIKNDYLHLMFLEMHIHSEGALNKETIFNAKYFR
jgi:hypothetical protein